MSSVLVCSKKISTLAFLTRSLLPAAGMLLAVKDEAKPGQCGEVKVGQVLGVKLWRRVRRHSGAGTRRPIS